MSILLSETLDRRSDVQFSGASANLSATADAVKEMVYRITGQPNRCEADGEGFEPTESLSLSAVFKTAALNHSATHPVERQALYRAQSLQLYSQADLFVKPGIMRPAGDFGNLLHNFRNVALSVLKFRIFDSEPSDSESSFLEQVAQTCDQDFRCRCGFIEETWTYILVSHSR